jgi:phosphoribosylformimino-5-aminoimidazole carboxamide ribotide isomerase
MRVGVNYGAYAALATQTNMQIIASGGVSSIDDIVDLRSIGPQVEGVIVGRALYEDVFSLADAIAVGHGRRV